MKPIDKLKPKKKNFTKELRNKKGYDVLLKKRGCSPFRK